MDQRTIEQLAMFMNARDAVESGTVRWPDLDEVGREAYRKDAAAVVAAMRVLGWAPKLPDEVA